MPSGCSSATSSVYRFFLNVSRFGYRFVRKADDNHIRFPNCLRYLISPILARQKILFIKPRQDAECI